MGFVSREGRIYMRTDVRSKKIGRIQADASVRIAPCTALGRITGTPRGGRARLLPPSDVPWLHSLVLEKYGLAKRLVDFRNRMKAATMIVIEITPTEDGQNLK